MTPYRTLLLRTIRRSSYSFSTTAIPIITTTPVHPPYTQPPVKSPAEEAREAQRKEKRRRRIEPPLHALRPSSPRPPHDPRLPDSTSALVGPRLSLHNRVQSLIRGGDLDTAANVARQAVFSRTRPTVFTCNAIIASMYRAGRYDQSILLFQYFFNQHNIVPNIVSYNNLINAYSDSGKIDIALDVYRHILANAPFSPSAMTYRHLTKGLVNAGRISDAVDLVREMISKAHGADSHVYNNIIAGYLELGNIERANEFFEELQERCLVYDGIVHATYMEWYFKKGMEKEAMKSYHDYLDREWQVITPTYNVLLELLLKYGKSEDANALFQSMLDKHKTPVTHTVNSETYNIMVNECFRLGKILEARAVFRQIGTAPGSKPFHMDGPGYNNMIEKLCENGMVAEAEELFDEMLKKSVVMDYNTYKFLIEAYFKEERVDDVLEKFSGFLESHLQANSRFFNMVFSGLLHRGRIEEAGDILGRMGNREVKPDPTVYQLVITTLCKESKLDLSRDLLCQMVQNNVGVTLALRASVDDAFSKGGRIDEIERLFDRPHQAQEERRRHQTREGNFSRTAVNHTLNPPYMAATRV